LLLSELRRMSDNTNFPWFIFIIDVTSIVINSPYEDLTSSPRLWTNFPKYYIPPGVSSHYHSCHQPRSPTSNATPSPTTSNTKFAVPEEQRACHLRLQLIYQVLLLVMFVLIFAYY
jgi:hypothetical protein